MSVKKFRKKPVVVEAEQWFPGKHLEGVYQETEEITHSMAAKRGELDFIVRTYVVTIHDQKAYLSPGDWVIKEGDGVHCYPCKPDVFAATYNEV